MAKNPRGDYDPIFKENFLLLSQSLVQYFFGVQPDQQTDLPTEFNRSAQRRVDWLKHIKTQDEEYILHLEVQAQNDPKMAERMMEYWLLLQKQYQLPIKQTVFYVGSEPLTMRDHLKQDQVRYRYRLINVQEIPARRFLKSDQPEEILLAILGDYQQQKPEEIARSILNKINRLDLETPKREKYVRQLEIISKLRNLTSTITQIITDMAIQFNLKDDPRYQQGLEQGLAQGLEQGEIKGEQKGEIKGEQKGRHQELRRICHSIAEEGFSIAQIARLVKITEEEVKRYLAEKDEEQP